MQWVGKALGAALGFAVAGPVGSLFGALLGHQFDEGWLTPGEGGASGRAQRKFFETSFEVMGHLAKADGRVSEEEIGAARRIMHAMQLSPEQVRSAIERFNLGKRPGYPLRERLDELASGFGARRDLARAFVEIQVQAAIACGEIPQAKRQALWGVASRFGIGRAELAQIEALIRTQGRRRDARQEGVTLEAAYRALGLASDASDEDVKTAYRRLMNQHHPDKLAARGMPESMLSLAEGKTYEIRSAYERIKADRGFK